MFVLRYLNKFTVKYTCIVFCGSTGSTCIFVLLCPVHGVVDGDLKYTIIYAYFLQNTIHEDCKICRFKSSLDKIRLNDIGPVQHIILFLGFCRFPIDLSRSESRTHFLLDSAGISEITLQLTRGLNFIKREVDTERKYQYSMIT